MVAANILSFIDIPGSDSVYRQSPPAKPASLSTVSSAKRGIAGSMNSRHMKGAMIINIRRCVSFPHSCWIESVALFLGL